MLIRNADAAMYERSGGGNDRLFEVSDAQPDSDAPVAH